MVSLHSTIVIPFDFNLLPMSPWEASINLCEYIYFNKVYFPNNNFYTQPKDRSLKTRFHV